LEAGSALRHLKETIFPWFRSLGEQERFARAVAGYEWLRGMQREAEQQSKALFQGLLREAFEGV
jgi:hypothetical protein